MKQFNIFLNLNYVRVSGIYSAFLTVKACRPYRYAK